MQKMYEEFGEVAEMRIVYIKEAHAADGKWPVGYAKDLDITEHTSYGQRCQTAERLLKDKKLTIPTLIDNMDDEVNKAYRAFPDRVYLVRKDGRLGVAAKPGPWGFKPGLNAARKWLEEYKRTGVEPAVAEASSDADEEHDQQAGANGADADSPPIDEKTAASVVGRWQMKTEVGGQSMEATMSLAYEDGKLSGVWQSQGREMPLAGVRFINGKLSFRRSMGRGPELVFEGAVHSGKITGKYTGPFGELVCTGTREPS